MGTARTWTALATAGVLVAVTPARFSASAQEGSEPACTPVLRALQGLGAAPRYHWTMSATSPGRRRPLEREQVVLGEIVYLTPDEGRWMKQRVPPAERVARMADELARSPVSDCRRVDADNLHGAAMQLYTYKQGTAATDGNATTKHIWIGAEDGLPHFFTSAEGDVSVTMRVEYDRVENPLP